MEYIVSCHLLKIISCQLPFLYTHIHIHYTHKKMPTPNYAHTYTHTESWTLQLSKIQVLCNADCDPSGNFWEPGDSKL